MPARVSTPTSGAMVRRPRPWKVLETGAYSVTVTDANGCIGTDEVIVTVINSVKDLAVGGQLDLFPNPSSGLVNLTFKEFIPE
ncbi:MAG: hypothetical protein IPG32_13540 [Saprospirales bacterium]|nr:hypothetical protein [Saprospirales bacterium]